MPASLSPDRRSTAQSNADEGSALIEFIALTLLLLLPVVWLITAAASLQASAYAATAAADQAAKVYAASGDQALAAEAAGAVLRDFGHSPEAADLRRSCSASCEPGAVVHYTVDIAVPLPAAPEFLGSRSHMMTVSSTAAHVLKEP
ncbi:hypothetical protein [Nesterenkonia pannonica]|uniref:hypothetical protein n=1 Tax=Nesterenkonia pannonica TaxID=1548602 RepID=UPI00216455CB|nr:hypothetical protein [Nesterenkonia pannonica]